MPAASACDRYGCTLTQVKIETVSKAAVLLPRRSRATARADDLAKAHQRCWPDIADPFYGLLEVAVDPGPSASDEVFADDIGSVIAVDRR